MIAFASLNNGSLTDVSEIDNYPEGNNVSGPPLNSIPYNGCVSRLIHTSSNFEFLCTVLSSTVLPTSMCRRVRLRSGLVYQMPYSAKRSKHPEDWILLSKIHRPSQITPSRSTCVYFTGHPRTTSPESNHYDRLSISPLRQHQTTSCRPMRP